MIKKLKEIVRICLNIHGKGDLLEPRSNLSWHEASTAFWVKAEEGKTRNRHFWARGYYVDTVGRNKKQIQEYIKNQLTEDQVSMKEFIDPFTGRSNQKINKTP